MAGRILIIDDEPDMLSLLREVITSATDLAVDATTSARQGVGRLREVDYDVVVTDLKMPEMDGLEVLNAVKRVDERLPVVVLTAFASVESAVAAMQLGAFDYLTKPFKKDNILLVVRRAVEWRRLQRQLRSLRDELNGRYRHLVGQSPAIREVERLVGQVAAVEVPVLVCGPRGSGKAAVARAIHGLSRRREGPYVPALCAGQGLAEGELAARLFGQDDSGGLVAAAGGGSLYLDDVTSLSLGLQGRLAELAQGEGGGERRFRLLAGVTAPLGALKLDRGLERLLAVFQISLPALAGRREDIPLLAQHFAQRYGRLYGKEIEELSERALRWLTQREWPGNVAELENVMQRAVIMARGKVLEESDLVPADYVAQRLPFVVPDIFSLPLPEAEERLLAAFHREYLRKSLAKAKGDPEAAAEAAGMGKNEFMRLLKEYDLEAEDGK